LARNELLGTESGFFKWDGTTDDGRKARVGYYLVHFEVFDIKGNVRSFKETVVVGAKFR